MDEFQRRCLLRFGESALYRIVVQGQLDRRTVTHMADARIETGDPHTTQLLVRVMDQAGLSGVLEALYGFHLPIVCVQLVNDEAETK